MQYEIRVWKDATKMPDLEPKSAENRVQELAKSIKNNPDILIDTNFLGEGVINFAEVSFENVELKNTQNTQDITVNLRIIKMHLKGFLYLPLTGEKKKESEVKNRNTLLLSEWASIQPDADKQKFQYYRGVILSIVTKAGDFRIVRANNVYVESYIENYQDGEFGTFELKLAQRIDESSKITVKGVDYEKESAQNALNKGIEKSANKKSRK